MHAWKPLSLGIQPMEEPFDEVLKETFDLPTVEKSGEAMGKESLLLIEPKLDHLEMMETVACDSFDKTEYQKVIAMSNQQS